MDPGSGKWYSRLNSWGPEASVRCGLAITNALTNSLSLLSPSDQEHARHCQQLVELWLADPSEQNVKTLRDLDPPNNSSDDERYAILELFVWLALLPLSQRALPEMVGFAEEVLVSFHDRFTILAPSGLDQTLLHPANARQTILNIVGYGITAWALETTSDAQRNSRLQKRRAASPRPFHEALSTFCDLGFFERTEGLAESLQIAFSQSYGSTFDETSSGSYCDLLALNRNRVWATDGEEDVMAGNDVYVSVVKTLERSSNGRFAPTSISEAWDSESGPISVTFEINSQTHSLQPQYLNDFVDLSIVNRINALLVHSDFQFYEYSCNSMSYFVFLNADEYETLCSVLGLRSN